MRKLAVILSIITSSVTAEVFYGSFTQTTYIDVAPESPTIELVTFVYNTETSEGTLSAAGLKGIFGENRIKFTVYENNEGRIGNVRTPESFNELVDFTSVIWAINEEEFAVQGRYSDAGFGAWIPFGSNTNSWNGNLDTPSSKVVPQESDAHIHIGSIYGGYTGRDLELITYNLKIGVLYTVQVSRNLKDWTDYEEIMGITQQQSWHSDLVPYWENYDLEEINLNDGNWFFRIKETL